MAAKRQTMYCESWEKEFPFLRGIPTDKYCGLCVAFNKTFRIDGSGISQVQSHMSGPTHLEHEKRMKNQAMFYRSDNGSAVTSKNKFVLLPYEQIVKAEVLQGFKTVESTFSFAAATRDGDRFRQMFPDSKIAQGYKQNETKMTYVIQYGLSPYFRESLKSDFHANAYCFKFDEATTSQVRKKYDGSVQYWSKSQNGIVVAYCGSLFVDHCLAEKLVGHFFTFIKSKHLTEMKDGEKHAFSVSKLLLVNTCDEDVFKGLRHIDIGTKASGLFLSSSLSIGEVEKNFRSDCLQAY